ncbi:MAG: sigma-70 family RNA polymerase sigma factor, partial [Bacteroidales bacterium]|nr:sigma-70 family RNA polymerase sigma factor [Bacteroidales bacterium]
MKGHETFNELILRYRRLIYYVCNRYSRDGLTADDLLQETTIVLWQRREKLFSITSPPKQAAWIWRVARSRCIDLLRRNPQTEPLAKEYDKPLENNALHDELIELIELLEEPDRTIAKMHLQGYEYKEIARATGMTKDNVG